MEIEHLKTQDETFSYALSLNIMESYFIQTHLAQFFAFEHSKS